MEQKKIAVVIPSYKVKNFILPVIAGIGAEVSKIYVIDDECPEETGKWVAAKVNDPRVVVLYNSENLGVGGATMVGYQRALEDGMDIVVKLDGDGQMDPALLPNFVKPILAGKADYVKGNRFFHLHSLSKMPLSRIIGNAVLSFVTKMSSGYWNIFDPTNGYTAIHRIALQQLPMPEISKRFFFESDILYHLNLIKAVVSDVQMKAIYGTETSNLEFARNIGPFAKGHVRNMCRRIFYTYYLRNFNIASIELLLGSILLLFGLVFGISEWLKSDATGVAASAGTVMLSAMPIIIGLQMLLSFLNYDTQSVPKTPLCE